MRNYLITELEKRIIEAFLERGEKLEGFRKLKQRAKALNLDEVKKQVHLIEQFIRKIDREKARKTI